MLTANKARRKSKRNRDKYLKQDLLNIENRIKDAVRFGCFSITETGTPDPIIKEKLEKLGYVVELTGSQSNYCVKWN